MVANGGETDTTKNLPASPKKKQTDSDKLRRASVVEYVQAHSKPNGNGWRGFFHSNLFTALVIWLLSQIVLVAGAIAATYFAIYLRTNQLTEWRNSVELTLKRMDEWGTVHSHYEIQELRNTVNQLEAQVAKLNLAEHDRLIKEVEELRNHNGQEKR